MHAGRHRSFASCILLWLFWAFIAKERPEKQKPPAMVAEGIYAITSPHLPVGYHTAAGFGTPPFSNRVAGYLGQVAGFHRARSLHRSL
jgi:hypothetical protein